MEDDMHALIILGRRFLAIIRCHIDVKNGKLSFDVGGNYVEFNLFKASKFASIFYEYYRLDVIDNFVKEEVANYVFSYPLEYCMLNDGTSKDANPRVATVLFF